MFGGAAGEGGCVFGGGWGGGAEVDEGKIFYLHAKYRCPTCQR